MFHFLSNVGGRRDISFLLSSAHLQLNGFKLMIRTKSQTVQLALHKNSRRLEATVTWRYCRVQNFQIEIRRLSLFNN